MKKNYQIILAFTILVLGACSTTKNIPDGRYLLNDFEIKTDNKVKGAADLESYIRQQPNGSLPVLGKVGLKIYNIAGTDTTKWLNRTIRKIGSEPVIYDPRSANVSSQQLKQAMNNMGYLEAEVDTIQRLKHKKVSLTYNIKTGTPYRIRNYTNAIEDTTIHRITKRFSSSSLLHKGDLFDMEMLEEERNNMSSLMRNVGYYNFSKDYIYFKADTTLDSHQTDLYLSVYPFQDSLPHPRYKMNNITIISGFNLQDAPADRYFKNADTTYTGNIRIIKGRKNFFRNSTLRRNTFLQKGMYYSDILLSHTYENYNSMGAIQQTNIIITPSSEDSLHLLDAKIFLTPANAHWFRASLDGTNSAGDIGVAPSLSYQHQNLFNGGEVWNITLKGAYEFITGQQSTDVLNKNYYEYGIETGISFPMFLIPWLNKKWKERSGASTKISLGLNNQHRSEYTRQFFNGSIGYGWSTMRRQLRHSVDLLDVNYVRMPWMSNNFRNKYLNDSTSNQLLKESYKNQLIARTSYSMTFTKKQRFVKLANTTTIRAGIEVAGALPRLITSLNGAKPKSDGMKELFGVAYAEYMKTNFDFARTMPISKNHVIAYHVGLGFAYPYGNSHVLPFERRFFAGGANSVRGWSTRSLGPGSYKRVNSSMDFINQTGDIKLEASIESRHKIGTMFELAGFVDAGNIWTIKNYKSQPLGYFRFSEFYKEIAVAYGLGLRFDLGFLLLRFDTGFRAYDPSESQSDRFVLFSPRLSRMAFHFGIGYPF